MNKRSLVIPGPWMKEAITSTPVVERGIPLPPPVHAGGRPVSYPWPDMEVGDSFFTAKSIRKTVAHTNKHGRYGQFTARVATRDGVKGYRVWRVS